MHDKKYDFQAQDLELYSQEWLVNMKPDSQISYFNMALFMHLVFDLSLCSK